MSLELEPTARQDRQWSRRAAQYDDLFLDPFRPGVVNPLLAWLQAIPDTQEKSVIDLGCGTGPLLPLLVDRFAEVTALDFAPGMIDRARRRLGEAAGRVRFETRPMSDLGDFTGQFDVAVAINSVVMPDVRVIDATLGAVRGALKAGGCFMGVVPAMDAIRYHAMLLMDQALDQGLEPDAAERVAAVRGEHMYYEFTFGRFLFKGLRQKFWESFEIEYRLRKAGFSGITLDRVLYPWDDDQIGGREFEKEPRSWDWSFAARP
jgi:SAM-dependent methyltransferase